MDTDALYDTFTHPKVVTSMLVIGIGLGLALSVMMRLLWGQWYLPVTFAALALLTVVLYMVWLDRQDIRVDQETDLLDDPGQAINPEPVIVLPAHLRVTTDSPARSFIFTNPRVVVSIFLLGIGLGIALCVLIILFRGTWYLPALFAALTIGLVVAFLYWLDGQDFIKD
jgi:hypothetical protein